jgi:release factor glutamine methyltransferase
VNGIDTQNYKKIKDLLYYIKLLFTEKGIEETDTEAEELLSCILGCSRTELYLKFNEPLPPTTIAKIMEYAKLRMENIPLPYIFNNVHFFGLDFFISKPVFIPRKETEILVEHAINTIKHYDKEHPIIADIGTGCGCIIISVAKALCQDAIFYASDIDDLSLEIARINIRRHKLDNKIILLKSDLFNQYPDALHKKIDFILANLPYVKEEEFSALPKEIQIQSKIAHVGGKNGLEVYERFIPQCKKFLSDTGYIFIELGYGEKEKIEELISSNGLAVSNFIYDYQHIPRICIAKRKI